LEKLLYLKESEHFLFGNALETLLAEKLMAAA
jgi:hypothetical protein